MAHERGLGIADPKQIELVGDDVSTENFGFQTGITRHLGDQMIRKGFLRPLERILLHSPLMVWAPIASNVYHDMVWYPTIGQSRIREFMRTEWGSSSESTDAMPMDHNQAAAVIFIAAGAGAGPARTRTAARSTAGTGQPR